LGIFFLQLTLVSFFKFSAKVGVIKLRYYQF
jgi:hypothetical protein